MTYLIFHTGVAGSATDEPVPQVTLLAGSTASVENSVSSIISEYLPEFVTSNHQTFVSFIDPDDTYTLTFNDTPSYTVGEQIIGSTSLNAATIRTVTFSANNSPKVTANELEGLLTVGETVVGQNSPTSDSDSPKSVTLSNIIKS